MDASGDRTPTSSRVLTVPNLISAVRIAMIPVFWALIVDPDTTTWGIVLFGVVVATDWVDGTIARRTGQV
jgi:cardiolipin synthase